MDYKQMLAGYIFVLLIFVVLLNLGGGKNIFNLKVHISNKMCLDPSADSVVAYLG